MCLATTQDAVNQISKEKFHTQNAQLGWRKWAMIHTNANVMVDIFWWLAATFFCKVSLCAAACSIWVAVPPCRSSGLPVC